MSDTQDFGFGQFVPGFDFLQNLAKGASEAMPQVPGLSSWIAPTLSVEELDKRISELRAVQFWLEQNGKALAATIQALEVQKMTLATLRNMDVTMTDLAEALRVKPQESVKPTQAAGAQQGTAAASPAPSPAPSAASAPSAPSQPVDPLQWWTALTGQFQQIAATAMEQSTRGGLAGQAGTGGAARSADVAGKTPGAEPVARSGSENDEPAAASKSPARKTAARKPAKRKPAAGSSVPPRSGGGGGGSGAAR